MDTHDDKQFEEPRPMSRADFDVFITEHYNALLRQVKRNKHVRDHEAADILHDVIARLFSRPEKIDKNKNPIKWVRTVLDHEIFKHLRERTIRDHVEGISLDQLTAIEEGKADEEEGYEIRHPSKFRQAITQEDSDHDLEIEVNRLLDESDFLDIDKEMFMRKLAGFSEREIGRELEVSRDIVKRRLQKIRQYLQPLLTDYARKAHSLSTDKTPNETDQTFSEQ